MKYFKRTLTLLLAFALAVTMALPVCAAETGSISASASSVKDDSVSVTVSVKNNPGFAALKLELSYDTDKLTFIDAEAGSFDTHFQSFDLPDGKVNLLWDKSNGNATGSGTLATLNFRVKNSATGSADVSLKFAEANNWDLNSLQFSAAGCTVKLDGSGTGGGGGGGSASTGKKIQIASEMSNGSVKANVSSADAGDTVTLTVTPKEGYELSKLTVKTKSGKTIETKASGTNTYTFTMPGEAVTIEADFVKKTGESGHSLYDDVKAADWYCGAVEYVTYKGLMNGMEPRMFRPAFDTTRCMVITILARMEGVETMGSTPWYAKAVSWAVEKGVSDGENPENIITREQLATMLYRFAQYKHFDTSKKSALTAYPDASAVSYWASDAMHWAVGTGLINGISGSLVPGGNTTRAQLATMLMRFCQQYSI